jgi:predicted Ser/Thr protein kinase
VSKPANECARCHTPLPVDGRYCSNCGMPSGESEHVCAPEPSEELRKRLAATLEGRYEISKLLGRGGMAFVFLAQDLALERQVAIKVLPPELSHDPKLIPRFQQEAKTAAKLDHPNIIPIYRVDSEAGLVYFVMKYVTGNSLDQLIDSGPVPFDTARRLLREAALALGHAHKRGIVHRDVKPANIMLEADGRVVLTDFGISKALEGGSGLTGTGNIIGTPHYMAPEQAKGLEVDGRADQYSLGVVGHHLLTGKQPFDGSSHSILYKHVFEQPPRIFEARPDAPADLCAALDRALSKEPERRFPTMEDFAAAVSGERTGPRTVVSAPVRPVGKPATRSGGKLKQGKIVQRSLLALALCAAIGGAAWAALLPYSRVEPGAPSHPSPAAVTPIETRSPQPTTRGAGPTTLRPTDAGESEPDGGATRPKPAKKEYALLTVASEPWGTLFLGNKEIGPTPIADYPLPVGTHRIRIEQEGYRTKFETIVVSGPNPIRRRYILEPAGPP